MIKDQATGFTLRKSLTYPEFGLIVRVFLAIRLGPSVMICNLGSMINMKYDMLGLNCITIFSDISPSPISIFWAIILKRESTKKDIDFESVLVKFKISLEE